MNDAELVCNDVNLCTDSASRDMTHGSHGPSGRGRVALVWAVGLAIGIAAGAGTALLFVSVKGNAFTRPIAAIADDIGIDNREAAGNGAG